MNLVIRNNNNVYELSGELVKLNVHLFQNEFQSVFDKKNDLTINLVHLDKIDMFGVNAITKLNNEAISKRKQLSIIGLGNQELFNHLKAVTTSEVRSLSSVNEMETFFMKLNKLVENYNKKFILPVVNAIHIL